jgi:hypothetical protein
VLARAAAGRAVEVPAVRPGRRTCLLAVGQNLRADGPAARVAPYGLAGQPKSMLSPHAGAGTS